MKWRGYRGDVLIKTNILGEPHRDMFFWRGSSLGLASTLSLTIEEYRLSQNVTNDNVATYSVQFDAQTDTPSKDRQIMKHVVSDPVAASSL